MRAKNATYIVSAHRHIHTYLGTNFNLSHNYSTCHPLFFMKKRIRVGGRVVISRRVVVFSKVSKIKQVELAN